MNSSNLLLPFHACMDHSHACVALLSNFTASTIERRSAREENWAAAVAVGISLTSLKCDMMLLNCAMNHLDVRYWLRQKYVQIESSTSSCWLFESWCALPLSTFRKKNRFDRHSKHKMLYKHHDVSLSNWSIQNCDFSWGPEHFIGRTIRGCCTVIMANLNSFIDWQVSVL